jgi:hypothetical protein
VRVVWLELMEVWRSARSNTERESSSVKGAVVTVLDRDRILGADLAAATSLSSPRS